MRRKPRIGLALGAGSARGWAHIGAIRALEERGIRPDVVCGTSIGALVAAAYASNQLNRLEEWVSGLAWTTVVRLMDLTWKGGLIRGERPARPGNAVTVDARPRTTGPPSACGSDRTGRSSHDARRLCWAAARCPTP